MILSAYKAGRHVGERWLWRNLSFDLHPGDRLGVVGPSGAGKTLLLRALAGLESPSEGMIRFQGKPLSEWPMPAYRARVAYLPQTPAFMEGTVEENLRYPFRFAVHSERRYDPDVVLVWLRCLERGPSYLKQTADVLSGGERQIAALLRALQFAPTVLLVDEPTANLDATATRQVEELIGAWLRDDPARAVVWTSHDAAQMRRSTERQITLTPPAVLPTADGKHEPDSASETVTP